MHKFSVIVLSSACSSFIALPGHAQDCQFGDGAVVDDFNGDGQLTPADLARWFQEQVGDTPMEDYDGDGVLTLEDVREFLRGFVRGIAGDLDGDGAVTFADMNALVQNQGADQGILVNHGDLNGDGVVNEQDFLILAERLGCPLDELTVDAAVGGILASLEFLPWSDVGLDTVGEGDHATYFSETWDHGEMYSNFWPPNHDGGISSSWTDPPVHNELQSEFWPPNHAADLSELWDIVDHSENGSDKWPPNHKLQRSQTWPDDHVTATSKVWPPNHLAADSAVDGQSPHEGVISSGWQHGQETSESLWPPSHPSGISGSWIDHDSSVSATWPPSHFSVPSNTWPGDESWPPNHFQSVSDGWNVPGDPGTTPVFPPDHSWWDSIIDVIPLLHEDEQ